MMLADILAGWLIGLQLVSAHYRTWAITAGIVTGYSMGSVLPIVVPSVRIPLGDSSAMRLSLIPPVKEPAVTGAVTLSLETQF